MFARRDLKRCSRKVEITWQSSRRCNAASRTPERSDGRLQGSGRHSHAVGADLKRRRVLETARGMSQKQLTRCKEKQQQSACACSDELERGDIWQAKTDQHMRANAGGVCLRVLCAGLLFLPGWRGDIRIRLSLRIGIVQR